MIRVRTERNGNALVAVNAIEESISGPAHVKVGFPNGKASGDIVSRATWNEFGTSRGIPERPFMRNALKKHRSEYQQFIRTLAQRIVSAAAAQGGFRGTASRFAGRARRMFGGYQYAGGSTMVQGLNQLGLLAQGHIQKSITELRTPPNAPSTIKRKGSSNPLIDTGEMRQSVTYEVEDA